MFAALLLAVPASGRAQGGNLSGVVLPDLPPEVSPGEEIAFVPPAGSEAGRWTLSGVVAEEEPPASSRPRGVPLVFQIFTCAPADGGPVVKLQAQPAGQRARRPSGEPLGKCLLKGGIAVKPGFVPARGQLGQHDQETALAGVELSIREPLSDRVLQRAVTDAHGNVTFEAVSGDDGSSVARMICNSAGDCFDLKPLPPDPPPVLEPIDFPDPPFVPHMERTAGSGSRPESSPGSARNLTFKVPETLKPGDPFSVRYQDPSGETLLDVAAAPGVAVVPARPVNPKPSLDAAPEYAMAGRPVCACGNFPDARSRNGFLFDGQTVGALSTSSRMAILPLPATVPTGRHSISGSPDAGFSARDAVFTNVINVNGKLDASLLRRGQSTQMELIIVGTDKPIALRVVNNTPGIISIAGRTDQVLTTTGGRNNHVVRKVDSVGPGNFSIDFSLAADRCPCRM